MKRLSVLLFAALAACSSTKTAYDYDKTVNFAAYKSYAFTEDSEDLGLDDLNTKRILSAIETELMAKGFTKSNTPDVFVDVHLKTEEHVEATATSTGGAYRYGYYGGVGMSQTTISYNEYTDGSLFISIVDAKTETLAWQGVGTKTLEEGTSPERREQNINYAVKQILYNYPPKSK